MKVAMRAFSQAFVHRAFRVGILLKGLDGIVEATCGIILLATPMFEIRNALSFLTQHYLSEDGFGLLAKALMDLAEQLSVSTQHFASVYLFVHGLVKVGLVGGLLRGLHWSYPAALLVLTAFILYQLHRLIHTHSVALLVLTVVDSVIVFFIWREWRYTTRSET
jgi:uncharacterized membrane protein